ncbi:unnamed protein product [[Candida] boidinii]|uniref:Unnamed protein product n=1 Tax=Candida boidinii TaxID=5477 RepID=A0ACB5TSC3_CANBO|nr:unnamed protein product [[Candida] boidinii]
MLLDDGPEINISKTSSFRTSDSLFNSSSPYGFSTNGSTKGKLKSDINYSGISSAPRLQSALKFEDPKKNGIPGLHTNNLSPTSSGVSKNKISRPQLTTSKSAGSILTNQKDKEKKKKKGFFKSIFS